MPPLNLPWHFTELPPIPWKATHRITFYPDDGGEPVVWLVMFAQERPQDTLWGGRTEEEWKASRHPLWSYRTDDGPYNRARLNWMGQSVPLHRNGRVEMERL